MNDSYENPNEIFEIIEHWELEFQMSWDVIFYKNYGVGIFFSFFIVIFQNL